MSHIMSNIQYRMPKYAITDHGKKKLNRLIGNWYAGV